MGNVAQRRAIQNYRARLTQRGFTRFEVMALDADRELIRTLARRLAEEGPQAEQVRAAVKTAVTGEPPRPARILTALRRSPLVGAGLDFPRPREKGRKVDL
ncbi:hypothetical protein [Bradyrhizobium tropiciagri]|uniref:hypothetical protein n=1 Tax=Bradyrhizobium tropiciagri TaxID=312253 RepID=UPI00067C1BDE|nr:hypothetical protein [Bradyrhizobium tropiciagri]